MLGDPAPIPAAFAAPALPPKKGESRAAMRARGITDLQNLKVEGFLHIVSFNPILQKGKLRHRARQRLG